MAHVCVVLKIIITTLRSRFHKLRHRPSHKGHGLSSEYPPHSLQSSETCSSPHETPHLQISIIFRKQSSSNICFSFVFFSVFFYHLLLLNRKNVFHLMILTLKSGISNRTHYIITHVLSWHYVKITSLVTIRNERLMDLHAMFSMVWKKRWTNWSRRFASVGLIRGAVIVPC